MSRLQPVLAFLLILVNTWAQQLGRLEFSPIPPLPPEKPTFVQTLPAFRALDTTGKTWELKDLQGHMTVITVWATSCIPCRTEHPDLQRVYEKSKQSDSLRVLTFSLDDSVPQVRLYMDANHYTFPVIVNEEQTFKLFPRESATGIPASWIVDRLGRRSEPFRTWTLAQILNAAQQTLR